ncbi:cardiolipin synthase ClsB [Alcaligenes aquatilis]|uniref:Cardiolipin synthase B n=1 Tax=Alcaligenes aquatilis TaxID=323284 RepID=A0A3G2HZC3_9BURK|nr:cardiolipin synthase ClsB [Alcaligenes aquatilis]AYN22434.1 cardiolipin synthase ClsB [Alcaligenes aquatilis]
MPSLKRDPLWHEGNQITLLQNGQEFFPAICEAIDQARKRLHLETYIFNLDDSGHCVLDALRRASERGVRVRVVIDGFGSDVHALQIAEQLKAMRARYRIYRPKPQGWREPRLSLRRLRRLHRKMLVVDERIGFVGGINILDDLDDVPLINGQGMPRFDFAVRCEGPIVDDMVRAQQALWLRMAWRRRKDWDSFTQRFTLWREWRKRRQQRKKAEQAGQVFEGIRATLLLRDNVRHRQQIEQAYLQLLCKAKEQVILANAYFFPGRTLRRHIEQAAERGVRVRLLLQGHAEYFLQYRACRFMYGQLLDHGIELYEYKASYLHAKVAVIDDYSMVGSSNLDPFSLLLAREANVLIQDQPFTQNLQTKLEYEIEHNAARVYPEQYQRLGVFSRLVDYLAYGMLRLGVLLTGKSSLY